MNQCNNLGDNAETTYLYKQHNRSILLHMFLFWAICFCKLRAFDPKYQTNLSKVVKFIRNLPGGIRSDLHM